MAFDIPVLETERLILRGKTMEDFPAFAAMWAHPDVARFTTVKPLSREDAWTKFARMTGMWALTGYGFWTLEEKATGRFAGEAGLADFKRDIEPALDGKPEFGWVLVPEAHGKGYASEAIAAALAWARKTLAAKTYCCIIDADNAASIKVAEKAGFQRTVETKYKGSTILIFERERR